jgi:ABC-2 type transport system ATP-binding protein
MSDHVVRTVELRRHFGTVRALDGLSLDVSKGTILTLLGPNGAGKTTLLRILMGLIEPTGGQAFVLGSPARSQPAGGAGRVAYVGDRCEPPDWATPALLEGVQAGASRTFERTLFRECCKRRGLSPKRPYGALSKGQRRWVLTSLALACRPELVLLDEPADGLDPAARKALYDALRDHVNECEATAVVTTHVIADVERIADDVAIMMAGRSVLHGPLDDLRENIRQVEMSGGISPPDLSDQVSILGRGRLGGASVVWIKNNGGLDDDGLRRLLGPDATVRNVGLETLYLAIAEHRPAALAESGKGSE